MQVNNHWMSFREKKKPLFFRWSSKQKCMKLKKKKKILKKIAQSFISLVEESNNVLFFSLLWEGIRDRMLSL